MPLESGPGRLPRRNHYQEGLDLPFVARLPPGYRSWISREYLWARIRGVGLGDAQAGVVTVGVGSSA